MAPEAKHQSVALRLRSFEASLLGLQMTTFPVSSNVPHVYVCERVYVYCAWCVYELVMYVWNACVYAHLYE